MPSPRRADHTWAKVAYAKARKIIYAQQSVCGICGRRIILSLCKKVAIRSILRTFRQRICFATEPKSTKTLALTVKEKSVSNRDLPLSADWSKLAWINKMGERK